MDFIWKSPVPKGACVSSREWVLLCFSEFPLFIFLLVMGIILYCAIRASQTDSATKHHLVTGENDENDWMQSDLNARSFTEPVQSLFKSVQQRVQGIHFSQCGQAQELKLRKTFGWTSKTFWLCKCLLPITLAHPFEIKEKGLTFKEERVGTMDFIWKSPVPAGPCDSRREWVWFGFIKFLLFVFLLVMGLILYCAIRASQTDSATKHHLVTGENDENDWMQSDLNARSFTEPVQSLLKSVQQRVQGIHFSQCGQAQELKLRKTFGWTSKPFAFANACCQSPWHTPCEMKEKGLTFKEERVGTMDFIWKSPVPKGACVSSREWVLLCFSEFPLFIFLLVMGIILYCAIRASQTDSATKHHLVTGENDENDGMQSDLNARSFTEPVQSLF